MIKDGVYHGLGTLTSEEEGFSMQGHFKHGKAHGQVKMSLENGNKFEGLFQDGVCTEGKVSYIDGLVYVGTCDEKMDPHGAWGKLTVPEHSVSEGSWYHGNLHGEGKIVREDGTVAEGSFYHGI